MNTAIDLEAAKDLYFDFVYPADATSLTMEVGTEESALTSEAVLPDTPKPPGE